MNAEFAVNLTGENFAGIFASMDDEYMKARSADVLDISKRLIRILAGVGEEGIASEDRWFCWRMIYPPVKQCRWIRAKSLPS